MRPGDFEQVRSLHLFKEMADESFARLVKGAFLQRFPGRVSLIAENERPDFLHVVLDGSVELYSEHKGRETILAVVRPVATFILAAVVGDLPYLASARTLEPSRILMLPADSVRSIFDADGAFARSIVAELSRSFRRVMKELKGQKLRTSSERLANWILVHAGETEAGRFTIPYDKRTLASRLGMTPENLSRNFAQLSRHGVAVNGREVVVRNPDRLTAFANPTQSIDDQDY